MPAAEPSVEPAVLPELTRIADTHLSATDHLVTGLWSTPVTWRQPVHTVYVPAHLLSAGNDIPRTWGDTALASLDAFGDDAGLARLCGVDERDAATVAALTRRKLTGEPIEDLRIDFEDGFTQRDVPTDHRDSDEDSRARSAAGILAEWLDTDSPAPAPAFAGIRLKSFDPTTRDRGIRTLAIVITELADRGHSGPNQQSVLHRVLRDTPRALRLTLPKVQHHSQVEAFVRVLRHLETTLSLPEIPFEVQIETPQAIVSADGSLEPPRIIAAGEGRVLSLHYGTYDYSASLGIDAAEQSMEHPVADFAKDVLQVATTAAAVELSDGSTNRIPVGTDDQITEGWRMHSQLVTRHLRRGIRQGWDLHPNQLVTRHLSTIAYFRQHWATTAHRLRAYVNADTSTWMDEPATAKAMAGYLLRARACGAVTDDELATTGVDESALRQLQATGRL